MAVGCNRKAEEEEDDHWRHLSSLSTFGRVEGGVEVNNGDSNPPVRSLFESLAVALSKAAHR